MAVPARISFYLNRVRERLWVKPLMVCLLSVGGVFIAKAIDRAELAQIPFTIKPETNETLLSIMAGSMLVIATFAVGSVVAAYASASNTATPRSFPLIVADDFSQTALSTFIGSFIFSVVSLIAVTNGYYEKDGHFALFALTLTVFGWVVLTFVRWVDNIARLGRQSNTIDKVEAAAARALERRRRQPTLGAFPLETAHSGAPVYGETIGYVQRIDLDRIQVYAEENDCRVSIAALPGTFAAPGRALAYVVPDDENADPDASRIARAFLIGGDRVFDEDPRFGLVVLSEIAGRALSPAVNDPGTAIDIIGTLIRLFATWAEPVDDAAASPIYDRVLAPRLDVMDMFDDAFCSIARDGAGSWEVAVRLQKAFSALAARENDALKHAARFHSTLALSRAERALELPRDIEAVREAARQVRSRADGPLAEAR